MSSTGAASREATLRRRRRTEDSVFARPGRPGSPTSAARTRPGRTRGELSEIRRVGPLGETVDCDSRSTTRTGLPIHPQVKGFGSAPDASMPTRGREQAIQLVGRKSVRGRPESSISRSPRAGDASRRGGRESRGNVDTWRTDYYVSDESTDRSSLSSLRAESWRGESPGR